MSRHQVFISSTYRDLRTERNHVAQKVLAMQCFPAGMELFPAKNEDPWKHIRRVIAESDYYVLLLAGRYGSVDEEGVSFTQREYEFAIASGVPVLAFLKKNVQRLSQEKSETSEDGLRRLAALRELVLSRHLCMHWSTPTELAGKVADSLRQAFVDTPRPGWVRFEPSTRSEPPLSDQLLAAHMHIASSGQDLEPTACSISSIERFCTPTLVCDAYTYFLNVSTHREILSGYCDESDYVVEMRAVITSEPAAVRGERRLAGVAECLRVLSADGCFGHNIPTDEICDAHSSYLDEVYSLILSNEAEFRRRTAIDASQPWRFLVLKTVQLLPLHRGSRIGLLVAKHLIEMFAADLDFVIIDARPDIPSQSIPESGWVQALDFGMFQDSEGDAKRRLRRYFGKLGGKWFGRTNFLVMDMALKRPSLEDLARR